MFSPTLTAHATVCDAKIALNCAQILKNPKHNVFAFFFLRIQEAPSMDQGSWNPFRRGQGSYGYLTSSVVIFGNLWRHPVSPNEY